MNTLRQQQSFANPERHGSGRPHESTTAHSFIIDTTKIMVSTAEVLQWSCKPLYGTPCTPFKDTEKGGWANRK